MSLMWILPRFSGMTGVWISMAGSDFLPFALAVIVMFITTRKYIRQYAAQHSAEGHS